MNIGERIRQFRKDLGYTQAELAAALNTTKQTIYKYENGLIATIPYEKLEKIARFLDTTPAILNGWEHLSGEIQELAADLENPDRRLAFYTHFRKTLSILGFHLETGFSRDPNGNPLHLIEDSEYQTEIPDAEYRELVNSVQSYIEFQVGSLVTRHNPKERDKTFDHLSYEEIQERFNP